MLRFRRDKVIFFLLFRLLKFICNFFIINSSPQLCSVLSVKILCFTLLFFPLIRSLATTSMMSNLTANDIASHFA